MDPISVDFLARKAQDLMETESLPEQRACAQVCRRYDARPRAQKIEQTLNALLKLQGQSFKPILAEAEKQVERARRIRLPYSD